MKNFFKMLQVDSISIRLMGLIKSSTIFTVKDVDGTYHFLGMYISTISLASFSMTEVARWTSERKRMY